MANSRKIPEKDLKSLEDIDFHNIREDWSALVSLVNDTQIDMDRFLKKKGKNASVRARNRLVEIKKISMRLRKSIFIQRQDNVSDYDSED